MQGREGVPNFTSRRGGGAMDEAPAYHKNYYNKYFSAASYAPKLQTLASAPT